MNTKHFALSLCVTGLALLSGCTAMGQVRRESDSQYNTAKTESAPYMDALSTRPAARTGGPIISDMPYVSTVPVTHRAGYPPIFDEHVDLSPKPGDSVAQLLHSVAVVGGIAVVADPDVLGAGGGVASLAPPTGAHDSTLSLPPPTGAIGGASDGGFGEAAAPAIHYSGDLKGLLDQLSIALDAKWSYDALTNTVRFLRIETKVFTLATLPGDASTAAAVGGDEQTVQGQKGSTLRVSGAKVTTQFRNDLTVWKSVGEAIQSMLSPAGKLTLSPATGTVVVRDRYNNVDAVAAYLQQINSRLQLAVQVNVTVYRIGLNHGDNRGIDWNIMYNTLGRMANRVGATIATPHNPIVGATSLILNAPSVNSEGKPSLFGGSQFFLQALSTLGHTSVVTHTSVYTTNNQPAPVKVVNDQSYLAETTSLYTSGVSSGNTGVVGAGATLTPGSVETGFSMQVLPSVQPDGHHMLLQLAISDSTLNSLDSVSSGGNSIQLPNVTARETMQRAWLQSGQTLVLAGFDDNEADSTTKTPFGKTTWAFGGNRNIQHMRDAIVIVITPVVTNAASDEVFGASGAASL